jgi:molybdopterin-guanine dinucleotide biosynthesis protein
MQREDPQIVLSPSQSLCTLSAAIMLEILSKRRKASRESQTPAVIAVGGFSSAVGKTTLVCDLLRSFPEWEAIKLAEGHYGTCDKDPESCGANHLVSREPVVHSGREQACIPGEDTGRYWEAGASNVHWVIATAKQAERGLKQALAKVTAPGVFVEGNSFSQYFRPHFMLMVVRPDGVTIKPSARRALAFATAVYVYDANCDGDRARQRFASWLKDSSAARLIGALPIFTREDLPELVAQVWATQLDHRKRKGVECSAA